MRQVFFILFSVISIVSCKGKNDVPSNIIAPEKMQLVLWDMIRADEFVSSYVMKDTSLNKFNESNALYESIYRIHDINRDKFRASLFFYRNHPAILRDMMDSLSKKMAVKPSTPTVSPVPSNVTPLTPSQLTDSSKLKMRPKRTITNKTL